MKILTISDIENAVDKDLTPVNMILKEINNDINIVIFAGDINPEDSERFFDILSERFKQIIWIVGNHDFFSVEDIEDITKLESLESKQSYKIKKYSEKILSKHNNIKLLYPCGYIEIDNIVFIGVSYNCTLNDEVKQTLKMNKKKILITHQPPFGILDSSKYFFNKNEESNKDSIAHIGSKEILNIIDEYNPNIHIFGDSHSSGQRKLTKYISFNNKPTLFVNISSASRMSQDKIIYTGVYGILDIDKMDIELRCLNGRKITCEICNEIAYIPYYWKRDKCSNCYENKSKIFDPHEIFKKSGNYMINKENDNLMKEIETENGTLTIIIPKQENTYHVKHPEKNKNQPLLDKF